MSKPKFKIIQPRGKPRKEDLPSFILEQDNWNDYSFQTQYHLSYYNFNENGGIEESLIGTVKILKRGQTRSDGLLLTSNFEYLGEEFCSVGLSLDYYERINALGEPVKTDVLKALRDVVQSPALVADFEKEEAWSISLFRGQRDAGSNFRILARGLITGDYANVPHKSMRFAFRMPGWLSNAEFNFRAPESTEWVFNSEKVLPQRIAVLVGKNGSGKSSLLARLARVAFGTLSERSESPLADLGVLEPEGVGFPRVITITFSPFDSFKLPGSDSRNQRQVIKDLERGEGRFCFIGLRDLAAECKSIDTTETAWGGDDKLSLSDRLGETRLKSIEQLADEFIRSLKKIHSKERQQLLQEIALDLFAESSDPQLVSGSGVEDSRELFLSYSTGHKIALLIVTGLLANIEPYSLVLVDEPETHLHPPLLAALMHSLRKILREHQAFAIVATHSPVVVQESLAQHVRIVRREGELNTVVPLTGETFGESIGLISAEVFGLQTDATDFHKILDRLMEECSDLEAIEELFLNGAMSHQARAYVMARLSTRQD